MSLMGIEGYQLEKIDKLELSKEKLSKLEKELKSTQAFPLIQIDLEIYKNKRYKSKLAS